MGPSTGSGEMLSSSGAIALEPSAEKAIDATGAVPEMAMGDASTSSTAELAGSTAEATATTARAGASTPLETSNAGCGLQSETKSEGTFAQIERRLASQG